MVWSYTFNSPVIVSLTVIISKNFTNMAWFCSKCRQKGGGGSCALVRSIVNDRSFFGPEEKAKVQGIAARLCILIHTS